MRQEHFVQKLLQQVNCRKSRLKTFQHERDNTLDRRWEHCQRNEKISSTFSRISKTRNEFNLSSGRRLLSYRWAKHYCTSSKKWNLPRCSAYSWWFCTERLCIDQLTNGTSGKSYEAILCHAMIGVSRCQVLVFQWSSPTKSVDMLPCNDFGKIWILKFWSLLLTFCDYFLSCLHEQLAMFTGERSATSRTRCPTMFEG